MQVLKGVGSIALALGLAYAWPWTGLLKDGGLIDDTWRMIILLALTIVFTCQQVWLVLPKPIGREEVDARQPVIAHYLRGFLGRYYEVLQQHVGSASQTFPVVRVNVMLVTKRAKGLCGSFLKIYYDACPNGVAYSDCEKELRWSKGQGTCGWAWKSGDRTLYDQGNPDYGAPSGRLTDKQRKVVGKINSVLSLPVRQSGRVVGVLNLDSKDDASQTKFTDNAIIEIAEACRDGLSPLCFRDGVRR